MGISTNSKVAFICANDETSWAQPFIDELKIPSKWVEGSFSCISVNGAGFWDRSDNDISVPVSICEVHDNGKTIVMSSDYYGLINPARMDLPASLQAVVYSSDSCQGEPQDPIYAVLAENIRLHDFSDTSEVNKPAWYNVAERMDRGSRFIEEAAWDDEQDEELFDSDAVIEEYAEALKKGFNNAFTKLIERIRSLENLNTPFIKKPEMATVMGYLKSINHEEADKELGYDLDKCPQYPCWEYTNTEIICCDDSIELSAQLKNIIDNGELIAAKEEVRRQEYLAQFTPTKVGMSRSEYATAYKESLEGGEDITKILKVLDTLNLPDKAGKKIRGYILERIESPTSPVGQKLIAATEGEEVSELVTGVFHSGKYNRFRLPEEPEIIETEDEEKELTPQELFEQCDEESNYEPLFADAARCEDVIKANIETIALNYTEENEYAATGEEPQWLLSALLKAGAEFGGGSGGGSDEDEDEEQTGQKNAYDVPDNYGGTQIMDCIIKYGMSYEWVINWLNDWCAEKLKEEGNGITLINLPAGSVSYFSVATLLSENETSGDEEDIRFNNELIKRIQQHDSSAGYLVMLVVRPEEPEFHVVPSAVEQKKEAPIQETDSEVAVELTAEDRIDCLVDFMEGEDKISAAETYFSLQLEDEAMKVLEDDEWIDYVIAASDEHTFTPSKEEIAIAGKRAALAEAEDIDSPNFEFGNLHWALDKTDEEYLELFAEFTKQHLDKCGVVRGFCRWAFGITEYSMADNTRALFEPYWSMIKDHLIPADVNTSFTTNYDPEQVYCSELEDDVAERIEHPDVLPVLRKLGVDVITRADENASEKLQKDKKDSNDKRMARINAPDEEAEVREIRNVLGGRMAKLKEAKEPDLKSIADIAHLLWFFYRGAPWSEKYIKDASELGVSPYLFNTMSEDFILMMYVEHMSPEQCGDQWEIYAPQKLLPEIRAMLEQRFKAKTVPSAKTANLLNMQQDALDKYKKRAEEKELKKQVETEVIDFKGKRICVTGKLSSTRSEIEQLIKDMGGIVASGVSKTTDYLISGSDAGSKLTKAQELGIPVLSETQANRVFNEDEPPLTIGGLDETTRWADGWDGIWYKGNYYVLEGGDHEVYITVNKEYWEKEFKGKEAHTVGTNAFSEATWCIDFGCSDFVSEDLCEELFGEDGPFDWYEMTEEQQELIAKTSLERGEYRYMRHLGITSEYFLGEYCDEAMPDEAYAEVLGLDLKHTEVSMQG